MGVADVSLSGNDMHIIVGTTTPLLPPSPLSSFFLSLPDPLSPSFPPPSLSSYLPPLSLSLLTFPPPLSPFPLPLSLSLSLSPSPSPSPSPCRFTSKDQGVGRCCQRCKEFIGCLTLRPHPQYYHAMFYSNYSTPLLFRLSFFC